MLVSAAGMPAAPNFPDSVFSASAADITDATEGAGSAEAAAGRAME